MKRLNKGDNMSERKKETKEENGKTYQKYDRDSLQVRIRKTKEKKEEE